MKIPELKNSTKNKIAITGLAIIFLPFAFFGMAMAYDNLILNMMENSLAQNVSATHSTQKACEAAYQALLAYKKDNKIAIAGTGSPCPLN